MSCTTILSLYPPLHVFDQDLILCFPYDGKTSRAKPVNKKVLGALGAPHHKTGLVLPSNHEMTS